MSNIKIFWYVGLFFFFGYFQCLKFWRLSSSFFFFFLFLFDSGHLGQFTRSTLEFVLSDPKLHKSGELFCCYYFWKKIYIWYSLVHSHLFTLICLLSFVYSSQNRYAVWSDQCVNFYGTFCKICWYSSNCHSLVCTKSYLWYSWFAIKMWRVCKNKELTTEKIKNKKERIPFFFFFFCDGYYISSFGLLCTRDDECIETLKPKGT